MLAVICCTAPPLGGFFSSESSGYSLYFRVLIIGLFWLFFLSHIVNLFADFSGSESHEMLLMIILTAALLARFFMERVYNFLDKRGRLNERKKKRLQKSNYFFESHIYSAFMKRSLLMATLQSGKVYIGFVDAMNDQDQAIKWINMVPLFSGNRDTTNQRLKIDTYYNDGKSAESGGDEASPSHYRVTLPVDKIVSLQDFDMKVYEERFSKGDGYN